MTAGSPSAPKGPARLRGVEGLRAIAALSVLVYHCWKYGQPNGIPADVGPAALLMPHLALGVTLFFTLSGFLLYRPFVTSLLRSEERPSIGLYFRRRAFRIMPAYWVILGVVALVLGIAIVPGSGPGLPIGSLATDLGTFLRALLLVQSYTPDMLYVGIGPAWSLSVEVVFYVSLPLLALASWHLARGRSRRSRVVALLVPPALLLVLGLGGKLAAAYIVPAFDIGNEAIGWRHVMAQSFLAQSDLFSGGMTLAVLHTQAEDNDFVLGNLSRLGLVVGAALIAIPAAALANDGGFRALFYQSLMAAPFALVLAVVVLPTRGRRPHLTARLLEARPLAAVGLMSYSLFLWHEPLVHGLRQHELTTGGPDGFLATTALVLVLAISASTATYLLVERPAMRWSGSSRKPRPPADKVLQQNDRQAAP